MEQSVRHVYLVRHGETDMNRQERLQGHIDCELNDTGLKEAELSHTLFERAGISFDRVYSSPLKRAVKTASVISGGKEVIIEPLIMEMAFGDYEGRPYTEIDKGMWAFFHDPENVTPPACVEPTRKLQERTAQFIDRLRYESDKNVLVVTHGIALRAILSSILPDGEQALAWKLPITNCIVYSFDIADGTITNVVHNKPLSINAEGDTSGKF